MVNLLNKPKKGFLLLELVLYILLTSIFLLLLFAFVSNTYNQLNEYKINSSYLAKIWMAADLISNDIANSTSDIKSYKKITDNEIVFNIKGKDICWICKKNKMFRIEGNYSSLVCNNIEKFEIKVNNVIYLTDTVINSNKINIISFCLVGSVNNRRITVQKSVGTKESNE